MAHPLYVAFVWHMHQPYYANSVTGEHILPWARLHAVKDYLHMVEVLKGFPKIHQTFNFVPCLAEQLNDYIRNGAKDRALLLTTKPAELLTPGEKDYLLNFFFSIDWDRIVRRYPRYWQLAQLRNLAEGDYELFGPSYWRDLQGWFNLAWIDPNWLERDPVLSRLVEKGRNFTGKDVQLIISKQHEIMGKVLGTYRELQEAGQIEISTSPYFHPILPLLINANAAREASPWLSMPEKQFAHPEDAAEQLRLAVEYHEECFGQKPKGLWPSEGAVSEELLGIIMARNNFRWLASDEGILAQSSRVNIERDGYGHVMNPQVLYQPYYVGERFADSANGRHPLAIVFRDHVLSDRIGFVYQQVDGSEAAADLMQRLRRIRENLRDEQSPYLVSIILDGENCWERYEHNGDVFLQRLYQMLSDDREIQTVTVSEYLDRFQPRTSLPRLVAGSWINRNLETWIGEPEQNRAWEYLELTRERLIQWQREYQLADFDTLAKAWREIYIAEGSDWFWWYYSRNDPARHEMFDREFRNHLANVYRIMGIPSPPWLKESIIRFAQRAAARPPSGYISPRLSMDPTTSADWAVAGYVDAEISTGAMQRTDLILRRLYYGYNPSSLFLRLETGASLTPYFVGFYFSGPESKQPNYLTRFAGTNQEYEPPDFPLCTEVSIAPNAMQAVLSQAQGGEQWQMLKSLDSVAVGERVLEISLPLQDLGLSIGDSVSLILVVAKNDVLAEMLPRTGHLQFTLSPMT